MNNLGLDNLDWGSGNLTEISKLRTKYISALQEADNGDYTKLIDFVK
jgi:hypothetical protein